MITTHVHAARCSIIPGRQLVGVLRELVLAGRVGQVSSRTRALAYSSISAAAIHHRCCRHLPIRNLASIRSLCGHPRCEQASALCAGIRYIAGPTLRRIYDNQRRWGFHVLQSRRIGALAVIQSEYHPSTPFGPRAPSYTIVRTSCPESEYMSR